MSSKSDRTPLYGRHKTNDGFVNFQARLGVGANNLSSGGTYALNQVTRNRQMLEAAYRGSWLIGKAVDCPAEDMTQAGIDFHATLEPSQVEELQAAYLNMGLWRDIAHGIRWGRLFGGAIVVMLIEGQDMSTPLRPETVSKGQFKGLYTFDRWMVDPSLGDLVTEYGPSLGMPKYYTVLAGNAALAGEKIHHSRVMRFDGIDLPFNQRVAENLWGESVVERIYDRLIAFDSTTQGAAQLVYRAHLRTLKIPKLRELIAFGGPALAAVQQQIEMMRSFQTNEGLTVLDGEDTFETHQYTFSGLSDVLLQFGEQVSGAVEIPMVRLFGQSPAGLNSSGESDLRTYYDGVKKNQDNRMRHPLTTLNHILCRSVLDLDPPDGFNFTFRSLWQTSEKEKAEIADTVTRTVCQAVDSGLVSQAVGMKELRQSAQTTNMWSNITDKDIEDAENAPPSGELATVEGAEEEPPTPPSDTEASQEKE